MRITKITQLTTAPRRSALEITMICEALNHHKSRYVITSTPGTFFSLQALAPHWVPGPICRAGAADHQCCLHLILKPGPSPASLNLKLCFALDARAYRYVFKQSLGGSCPEASFWSLPGRSPGTPKPEMVTILATGRVL